MESAVNSIFSPIFPDKPNSGVLAETLDIDKLRKEAVAIPTEIEKEDRGHYWWEDKPLMDFYQTVFQSGCFST